MLCWPAIIAPIGLGIGFSRSTKLQLWVSQPGFDLAAAAELRQGWRMQNDFLISTQGQGLYEFTDDLRRWLASGGCKQGSGLKAGPGAKYGVLTLFVRHTSCSLLIQENADPDVQRDLRAFFRRLVPPSNDPSMSYLRHTYEGVDDMPAHIKAAMMPVSLTIPVRDGVLALGTWQGVYLFEHRDAPHQRQIVAHLSL